MQVSKTGSSTFVPAPKGTYQAVCVDVADEGLHANTFKEGNPMERKISIGFQLDKDGDNGKPLFISRWFTLSLHERSSLAAFLCEWHDASYAELPDDFDLEELIGRNARLRVIQEPKKNKPDEMRAVIKSIEPWEDEDNLLEPRDYVRKHLRDTAPDTQAEPAAPAANKFRPNGAAQPKQPRANMYPEDIDRPAAPSPSRSAEGLAPPAMLERSRAAQAASRAESPVAAGARMQQSRKAVMDELAADAPADDLDSVFDDE